MSAAFRAAAIQMSSGEDQAANLAAAVAWIEQAAEQKGAVVLPEMFARLGRTDRMVASAETIPGPTSQVLSEFAGRLSITLVAGSYCERSNVPDPAFTPVCCSRLTADCWPPYRKMHLFDIDLPGQVLLAQSSWLVAGDEVAATATSQGCLGQAICYAFAFRPDPSGCRKPARKFVHSGSLHAHHRTRPLGTVVACLRGRKPDVRDRRQSDRPAHAGILHLRTFGHHRSVGDAAGDRRR